MREARAAFAVVTAMLVATRGIRAADACGCLSPPAVTSGEFAVNQEAEQLIFEVDPATTGWVTAHVLIKYAGAPDKFAWIVPVPEVPELGLSPTGAFGLLDQLTAPDVAVQVEDICPRSAWACDYDRSSCGDGAGGGPFDVADGGAGDAGATGGSGVTVIDEKTVGDYQTVTFRASEAGAATQWLRDNGFIVNPTTSIYMEPYVQANMVFVAVKLVPGAGVSAIKPLRMRYRADYPMVPLVLTAVAAQPHLTVTSFVYSDRPFRPMGHPIVAIDQNRLALDRDRRLNYPMLLARTIDEHGGDGFAIEYRGPSVYPTFGNQCCGAGFDLCNLGNDGQCQCPADDYDHADCASQGDLLEGIAFLEQLATAHTTLTRITTRLSPEQMTFDPQFEGDPGAPQTGRAILRASQPSLAQCGGDVKDAATRSAIDAKQSCAAVYCGAGGECAATTAGGGCVCGPDTVAQRFLDLDGKASVTCVPKVPTCDLRAGGELLPDACAGVSCAAGTCSDRNGIAVCTCSPGTAAVPSGGGAPRCLPIVQPTGSPGAEDFSEGLRDLAVCAPPPPTCGPDMHYTYVGTTRAGVNCGNVDPPLLEQVAWSSQRCDAFGCGGCASSDGPLGALFGAWLVVGALIVRRRAR